MVVRNKQQRNIAYCDSDTEVYDIVTRECRDFFQIDLTSVIPFLKRYTAVILLRSQAPLSQNRFSFLKNAGWSELIRSGIYFPLTY